MDRALRLGIVGAGAAAELCHLPATKRCAEISTVTLAETNANRASLVAEKFLISTCVSDYRDLMGRVDAVIVALPNYLHAPVTTEFLNAGIPVLVEKPIALSQKDATSMVAAAASARVPLQVGLMYRYSQGVNVLRQAIAEGWLGRVTDVAVEWGYVFDWPATSGGFFRKEYAGGGVLFDFGSHMLDLILWIFGTASLISYEDDSLGGAEADCCLSLALRVGGNPVRGTVVLSRLRNLSNVIRVTGDRFVLEYDVNSPDSVSLRPKSEGVGVKPFLLDWGNHAQSWTDLYAAQLRSFALAVLGGHGAEFPADESIPVIGLIEQCYRERRPASSPWSWTERADAALREVQ